MTGRVPWQVACGTEFELWLQETFPSVADQMTLGANAPHKWHLLSPPDSESVGPLQSLTIGMWTSKRRISQLDKVVVVPFLIRGCSGSLGSLV